MKTTILSALLVSAALNAQISGCTDPQSLNYNPLADVNDGSCDYQAVTIAPVSSVELPAAVRETSGLIHFGNYWLTHNDSADTTLYNIDPATGDIVNQFPLGMLTNIDWEEIAQDEEFIYLGDFGNNATGNRTNLKIYKIRKSSLLENPVIEIITFQYEDQASWASCPANATEFDCEAFIVTGDSIYLFAKKWTSGTTTVYQLPKTPGSHTATIVESFNIDGLVTAATYHAEKGLVALAGYNIVMQPFIFLLYDFVGNHYFSGNKQKLGLSLPLHQVEAISTADGLNFYVTNERFVQGSFVNIPAKIHQVNLKPFLAPYYQTSALNTADLVKRNSFELAYDPMLKSVSIRLTSPTRANALLFDQGGRMLKKITFADETTVDVADLSAGMYILKISGSEGTSGKLLRLY